MVTRTDETTTIRLSTGRVPLTFAERELLEKFGFKSAAGEDEFEVVFDLNRVIRFKRAHKHRDMAATAEKIVEEARDKIATRPSVLDHTACLRLLRKIHVRRCLQWYGAESVQPFGAAPGQIQTGPVVIGSYTIPAVLHFDLGLIFEVESRMRSLPLIQSLDPGQRTDLKILVTSSFEKMMVDGFPRLAMNTDEYEEILRSRKQFPIDLGDAPRESFRCYAMAIVFAVKARKAGEIKDGQPFTDKVAAMVKDTRSRLAAWVKEISGPN